MTEYGDAGGAPPEVEVEDNRPLQERIGDKVRASIKVVSHDRSSRGIMFWAKFRTW
jgi:hypothetical protein